MLLYHSLPRKYLTEQIKGDKFYSWHDRQPYAKAACGNVMGIWCADNPISSFRASNHPDKDLVIMEINTDLPKRKKLRYENHGDFVNKKNGDYYILRAKKIPLAHINIMEMTNA